MKNRVKIIKKIIMLKVQQIFTLILNQFHEPLIPSYEYNMPIIND